MTSESIDQAGKIAPAVFERVIKPHLGARRPEVLVGPRHGVDVGIVDLGGDQVMALTTDPFFIMPEYGWERAAWFAVHIVASDAATSGLRPAYCAVDLNLPHEMADEDLAAMWEAADAACSEIGMAIVTGHTGRYDGCSFPMLGAATVVCVGPTERYVTPQMARVGDAVVLTKGAAIEATAQLAVTFPGRIASVYGQELARRAADLFWQMSVVRDCLTAVEIGVRDHGVTAMHDATERGVWGGLREIADASGVGMLVHEGAIPVRPEVRAICDLFGIDPFSASSEGTLLLTVRRHRVTDLIDRLHAAGIPAARVGEIVPPEQGVKVVSGGSEQDLEIPLFDPFWPAFRRAMEEAER